MRSPRNGAVCDAHASVAHTPLRAVYCTRGGWFGEIVLERLHGCPQLHICGVLRSSRTFDARFGFLRGALAYLRRCGVAYSAYLFCATTLAEWLRAGLRASRRGRRRPLTTPTLITRDINSPRALQFLADCAPDVLISAFFDQRLHEAALGIPVLGCLNIHPSLLPQFAGVDPALQVQLQNAVPQGVTVHRMSAALDAGDILAQRAVALPAHASVLETTARLFAAGAQLLIQELPRIARGERGTPQSAGRSYQSWPSRADIRALRRRGGRLMRWRDLGPLLKD